MTEAAAGYLLAGQPTELDRLQLQSRVWEPAARALLARLPAGAGRSAVDVGCGVMGWLRVLRDWVGPQGRVVGTDVEPKMLANAQRFVDDAALGTVTLVQDDLFASKLPPASFDLVHARFQLAPLGRAAAQVDAYRRLANRGGWIVLEEPEIGSWRVSPHAPAVERLVTLIEEGFRAGGGNFNAGRELPALLGAVAAEVRIDAHVVALPAGHPYLRLPLQFATALKPRLETLIAPRELEILLRDAEAELARPGCWGTTFTLVQAWVQRP